MDIDKKLDEILNSLVNQVEWCVNPAAGAISVNREKEQTAQYQAKQAIKQLFQELIEEIYDEQTYDRKHIGKNEYRTGWNDSIVEQRQRAKEILEKL
jgi:hypothetical protein